MIPSIESQNEFLDPNFQIFSKISSIQGRLYSLSIENDIKNTVKKVLEFVLKYLVVASQINEIQLEGLPPLICKLDKKIENQSPNIYSHLYKIVKAIGSVLLKRNEKEFSSLKDSLKMSFVFLQDPEFSETDNDLNEFEWIYCQTEFKNSFFYLDPKRNANPSTPKLNLKYFPSSAKNEKEYFKRLNAFKGCIQDLPENKVRNLIDDLSLNVPSGDLVNVPGSTPICGNAQLFESYCPKKVSPPLQVLVDFNRLDKLVINGQIIYSKPFELFPESVQDVKTISSPPNELFNQCQNIIDEDLELNIDITKLITQASLARPCIILNHGFVYEPLNIFLSSALRIQAEILTINSKTKEKLSCIQVRISAIFGVRRMELEKCTHYIAVRRQFLCDREYLKREDFAFQRKGKASIRDIYSPTYTSLQSALECNFEVLERTIKLHISENDLLKTQQKRVCRPPKKEKCHIQ